MNERLKDLDWMLDNKEGKVYITPGESLEWRNGPPDNFRIVMISQKEMDEYRKVRDKEN